MGSSDDGNKERSPWVVAGVFGALGVEFVGFVIAALVIGGWIDQRFEVEPYGTVACVVAGLLGAGWHIYVITKRFLMNEDA